MKETYELIEAKGKNDEIDFVSIAIHFEKNGEAVTNYSSGPLNASLPKDSEHDVIIHCALNAIGYGNLQKMREEAAKKLNDGEELSEVYYKAVDDKAERLYVRLALIEANLWKQVQKHFQNEKRTDVEITYFEESPVWSKTHPIFAKAISKFDNETINTVFKRAKEMSRTTNVSDVFV
jgi:hypothetical protein